MARYILVGWMKETRDIEAREEGIRGEVTQKRGTWDHV